MSMYIAICVDIRLMQLVKRFDELVAMHFIMCFLSTVNDNESAVWRIW